VCLFWGYGWRDFSIVSFKLKSILSTQCLQPSETCDSLSVDNILAMMMNSKTTTKPLVVVDGPDQSEETGQQKNTVYTS